MGLFPQESVGRARKVRCRLVDSFVWLAVCIDTAYCVTDKKGVWPVETVCQLSPKNCILWQMGWVSSRVVSVLDSGTEGPGFKLQSCRCLRQTVHTHCVSVHQAAKFVAALLRVAGVAAGLPAGLWLASPAGWLPRTGISSGTLCLVIDYRLPLPFTWKMTLGSCCTVLS